MNDIETLKQYALDHYGSGGHWIYETFSDSDYARVLAECQSVEIAKKAMKRDWQLMLAREGDCRYE